MAAGLRAAVAVMAEIPLFQAGAIAVLVPAYRWLMIKIEAKPREASSSDCCRTNRSESLVQAQVQANSAARYRAAWERIGRIQDVVIQALARDIDESPYVYMETKLHPRTFRGVPR